MALMLDIAAKIAFLPRVRLLTATDGTSARILSYSSCGFDSRAAQDVATLVNGIFSLGGTNSCLQVARFSALLCNIFAQNLIFKLAELLLNKGHLV
jgi:hypothetical protein